MAIQKDKKFFVSNEKLIKFEEAVIDLKNE
jgi:hypothetical protein